MKRIPAKSGFTLIETMSALVILGLTVGLVVSIGARSPYWGFTLGGRALATIDKEVDRSAFDDLVQAIVIPPINLASQAAETKMEMIDDSFVGDPIQLSGRMVATRETACAPTGMEARLTLSVEKTGDLETTVFCSLLLDDGTETEPVALLRLRWPDGAFSYSEDGVEWSDSWEVYRGTPVDYADDPNQVLRKVNVRLASTDGRAQIVQLASSGRALPQRPVTAAAQNSNGNKTGNNNGGRGGRGGDGAGGRDGGGRDGGGIGGGGRGGIGGGGAGPGGPGGRGGPGTDPGGRGGGGFGGGGGGGRGRG